MTEFFPKAEHDAERERLQDQLITIDGDAAKLQSFIGELYNGAEDNPHILYAAAAHLTSLTYLERHDHKERIILPTQEEAGQAFVAYAQLLAILGAEKDSPLYEYDERIGRDLTGVREELAFHATLAFARAQGADFVALTTPAIMDFAGGYQASDLQIFFAGANRPALEIQVKYRDNRKFYGRRIAILSLASALGDTEKAARLRGLLKHIGQDADGTGPADVNPREEDIIMSGAASIMEAAYSRKRLPRVVEP